MRSLLSSTQRYRNLEVKMATAGIEVYVKLPTGKVLSLQHWPGHTVGDIAKKVADSENVPEPRVRLKYQGKTLDKKKTISYLGICMETILKAEVCSLIQLKGNFHFFYTFFPSLYLRLPLANSIYMYTCNSKPNDTVSP